jgi:hypothetical protein
MAAYKIKKIAWLRRRFIQSEALLGLESWFDVSEKLKELIKTDSTFQLVGDKTILSLDSKSQNAHVLVEVLGIPKINLKIVDHEPCELLIYQCPETAFSIDFATLKARALDLMGVIKLPLEDHFHIVSDGLNLELHFFIQKDYIHS